MRKNVVVDVSAADRVRLQAILADRNRPQKHVWRAQIVLLTAARLGTVEITRRTGRSRNCVWRWQERFMQAGVNGLRRDKTRPSRVPPLAAKVVARVTALTQNEPPGEATHWTGAAMGLSRSVCIWHSVRIDIAARGLVACEIVACEMVACEMVACKIVKRTWHERPCPRPKGVPATPSG